MGELIHLDWNHSGIEGIQLGLRLMKTSARATPDFLENGDRRQQVLVLRSACRSGER